MVLLVDQIPHQDAIPRQQTHSIRACCQQAVGTGTQSTCKLFPLYRSLTLYSSSMLCLAPILFSLTSFLGQTTASHCHLAVSTCCILVSSLAVPSCTIPVSSCVSPMLTCVWLCLWQPIAFSPFTSCSACCLSEAIRTCIYKP